MSDYWDRTEDRDELYSDVEYDEGATGIMVNGAFRNVESGTPFKSTVKDIATDAGLGKFRVFLNGAEIKPQNAPETFNEGDQVELRPYDQAG